MAFLDEEGEKHAPLISGGEGSAGHRLFCGHFCVWVEQKLGVDGV